MSIVDEFRQDGQRVLDRLVDGELSQADRRALLAALDDEPDAWRQCALAFLEAQTWRWQMARAAAEPQVMLHSVARAPAATTPRRYGLRWGAGLAVAASLLVAFALGRQFAPNEPAGDEAGAIASAPVETAADFAISTPDATSTTAGDVLLAEAAPWHTLTLAVVEGNDAESTTQPFEVRVRTGESAVSPDALWEDDTSVLSAALIGQLEQDGWKVTRQRRLVPVDLSDGRRLIMPVEEVDFQRPEYAQF